MEKNLRQNFCFGFLAQITLHQANGIRLVSVTWLSGRARLGNEIAYYRLRDETSFVTGPSIRRGDRIADANLVVCHSVPNQAKVRARECQGLELHHRKIVPVPTSFHNSFFRVVNDTLQNMRDFVDDDMR